MFRATDTKLKRQVAIKILPPSLASGHDRLAHFQGEAAQFSLDGKWVALASTETGTREVYFVRFPDGRVKVRVGGGYQPRWADKWPRAVLVVRKAASHS